MTRITVSLPFDQIGRFQDAYGIIYSDLGMRTLRRCPRNFQGAYSIHKLKSIYKIGNRAFEGCTSLTHIAIPVGVKEIGDDAFLGCSALTTITIPSSIIKIEKYAFLGCNNLREICVPTGHKARFLQMDGLKDFADIIVELDEVDLTRREDGIAAKMREGDARRKEEKLKREFAEQEEKRLEAERRRLQEEERRRLEVQRAAQRKDEEWKRQDKAKQEVEHKKSVSDILQQNGISRLYHFTSRRNLQLIRQHGGLYSWYYLENNNIAIPKSGGDETSHSLDRFKGLADYVHLSFCRDHPMAYRHRQDGEDIIILEIALDVALFEDTLFSDMNAVDNLSTCAPGIEGIQKINFRATKAHYVRNTDPLFKFKQAEVLVKRHIPAEYILNLDNF